MDSPLRFDEGADKKKAARGAGAKGDRRSRSMPRKIVYQDRGSSSRDSENAPSLVTSRDRALPLTQAAFFFVKAPATLDPRSERAG